MLVLNHNGLRWLPRCIGSLESATGPKGAIIVVDNGSDDGSLAWLRRRGTAVVGYASNLGYTGGYNVILRDVLEAGARAVVLLNNDLWVEAGWLQALERVAERHPDAGIVGPIQLEYESDAPNTWTSAALASRIATIEAGLRGESERKSIAVNWVEGSCMWVRTEVFDRIGWFDPIYRAFFEEIDFCRRARYAGYDVRVALDSRIHHHRGGTWMSDEARARIRDRECLRSQFVYSLCDPRRSLVGNLADAARGTATNLVAWLRGESAVDPVELLRIQIDLAVHLPDILRKWRYDRRILFGAGTAERSTHA